MVGSRGQLWSVGAVGAVFEDTYDNVGIDLVLAFATTEGKILSR